MGEGFQRGVGGTTAALRVITAGLGEPDGDAHAVVHRAFRRSADIDTVWRILYELPPNDPRYLDMTEEAMLEDLLITYYRRMATRREMEPGKEVIADLAADSKKLEQVLDATKTTLETPENQRALRAIIAENRKVRNEPQEPAPPVTLRMTGAARTLKDPNA